MHLAMLREYVESLGGGEGGDGPEQPGGDSDESVSDEPIVAETYKFADDTGIFLSVIVNDGRESAILSMLVQGEEFEMPVKLYQADGCYVVDVDTPKFAIVFDNESKTASFYKSDDGISLKYHYNPYDDTVMDFEIYGDYVGAGNYFCAYVATVEGVYVKCAIQVYLDLENKLLSAGESAEFFISEDGYTLTTGSGGDKEEPDQDEEIVTDEIKEEILSDFAEEVYGILGDTPLTDELNERYVWEDDAF